MHLCSSTHIYPVQYERYARDFVKRRSAGDGIRLSKANRVCTDIAIMLTDLQSAGDPIPLSHPNYARCSRGNDDDI